MPPTADDIIHRRMMHELTEPSPQHPGVQLPKKDKILEWTLYNIYLELRGIQQAAQGMLIQSRTGR